MELKPLLENPLLENPLLENPLLEKVEQNSSGIPSEKAFTEISHNDKVVNDFHNYFNEKNAKDVCCNPVETSSTDFIETSSSNPIETFCSTFFKSGKSGKSGNLLHLKIFVSGDYELKKLYLAAAENHNQKVLNNKFIDAGFDLFTPLQKEDPEEVEFYGEVIRCFGPGWEDDDGLKINPVNKIDFKVKCSAKIHSFTNTSSFTNSFSNSFYTGYFLYPRSSISKTPLRLANSLGIIDSGYRGNLIGMFDVVNIDKDEKREYNDSDYYIKKYDKLVQICAPNLCPIFVEIVDTLEQLGEETERGEGGFGSTSTSTF